MEREDNAKTGKRTMEQGEGLNKKTKVLSKDLRRIGGDFEKLPSDDSILKMILDYLNKETILNMRTLSSWFVERVTFLKQSLFKIFDIKGINDKNCVRIMSTLANLMDKDYIREKKLKLQFKTCFSTMKEILVMYKGLVISLDFNFTAESDSIFLQNSDMKFDLLESLSITTDDWPTIESLLIKYANKLKILKVSDTVFDYIANPNRQLKLPQLSSLEYLALEMFDSDAASAILKACNPTITRLDMVSTDSDYKCDYVPNLSHLTLVNAGSFNFVNVNASHLVSLTIGGMDIFISVHLPQLPNLKELDIDGGFSDTLPLIRCCTATLECLVYSNGISIDDFMDLHNVQIILPRLTDLYLYNTDDFIKFLRYNHSSLNFLFLEDVSLGDSLGDNIRMERMETVVMKYYCNDEDSSSSDDESNDSNDKDSSSNDDRGSSSNDDRGSSSSEDRNNESNDDRGRSLSDKRCNDSNDDGNNDSNDDGNNDSNDDKNRSSSAGRNNDSNVDRINDLNDDKSSSSSDDSDSNYSSDSSDNDWKYSEEKVKEMSELCPNANILVWKRKEKRVDIQDLVRDRHRCKGFTVDIPVVHKHDDDKYFQ